METTEQGNQIQGLKPPLTKLTVRVGRKWKRFVRSPAYLECDCGYQIWDWNKNQSIMDEHVCP